MSKKETKLRVAAYIRVSSSSADHLNSFEAQRQHYEQLIASQEDQELVGIYADEGITSTSMEKWENFLQLLSDCRRGLIDRVLVKSVSSFACNTKECLIAVRELNELGVSVYFEEQHIDTNAATSEMDDILFTICAHAESEYLSKSVRSNSHIWMKGMDLTLCKPPFGYELVAEHLEIKNDEAQVVKEIFNRFLKGDSTNKIASWVSTTGFPTQKGSLRWHRTSIAHILQNQKYVGDTVFKRSYASHGHPPRKAGNLGEHEWCCIVNTHPAIIDRELFKKVQELYTKRRDAGGC